ncbi:tRNA (adenosine(37)-N6)-dimethylallyltransferase MiaA [Yunchengibacter salinarum]|uniref:tRNA (adenosine(37)-N6)-dimethylallyltransferase MiaA n=1 Tax=Yunchengibacter salinarum TaxID=3133399 RepID=UPI0035B5C49E
MRALLIAGPTASGKSALALALAETVPATIINADSMQVYRDLRLLTARPDAAEEARAPHRLFGEWDGARACSVAEWAAAAEAAMAESVAAGRLPVLVGGTGLYFTALLDGLAPVPDIPDPVRADVRAEMAERGPEALHVDLKRLDPALAARLAPGDSQRIARGLEVVRATGRCLSDWQRETVPGPLAAADQAGRVGKYVITWPRDQLYARIEQRFDAMMASGVLDEVAALRARGLDPNLPVMRSLGVPPLLRLLEGTLDEDDAVRLAKQQTRQFAKRQLTWLRNRFGHWGRLDAQETQSNLGKIVSEIMQKTVD